VWLLACAHPSPPAIAMPEPEGVISESVRSGPARGRLIVGDGADLVLLYGGEQEGQMGPCGCEYRERGSLARVDGYRRLLERSDGDTPTILLNAGAWLDNTIGDTLDLRVDAKVANVGMTEAVALGRWDVLNVGFRDMPWFREATFPANAVSANVRPIDGAVGPEPYVVVEAGALRVAVTGLSVEGMTFIQPETHRYEDPFASLEALIPEMREEADLVVVLGYHLGRTATQLTQLDVDVLIDADGYKEQYEPTLENGTLWVRSRWRTERLGELRLFLEDGTIRGARDRMIDLDHRIPETRSLLRLDRRVQTARDEALLELVSSRASRREGRAQMLAVDKTSY